MENFILIQIKDIEGITLTTFKGEPHHVQIFKDYITETFINETDGITIWIELPILEHYLL